MDRRERDALTQSIVGAAIEVHRELGPGLLEQSYEACRSFELLNLGLRIERQKALPVKAIERFERVHFAQLLSYLRFAHCQVGLLLNFNVAWLSRQGIKRVVNRLPE